ncbi:MAG: DUF362 domain-containing protein [Candidatus Omnitrophica bacterium]|nr:DUF362 domain-containing protein [Candidatus Omnitrophota bacterium]
MSQVSIIRCADYELNKLYQSVKQSVDAQGGIDRFIKTGQSVLLKPNFLKIARPEEAVITHPEFIRAVIRLVKTVTDKIFIGDSPGGLVKIEDIYEQCGIRKVAQEENVELVRFDKIKQIGGIPFASIKDEVDVVISLPKLKTHNLTSLTCAIKNVFGLVPGLYKVHCHKKAPNFQIFAQELVRIYSMAVPNLSIIDGVLAMQGEGPSGGDPYKLGLVIASADAVAADSVVAKIIGLKPFSVPSIKLAHEMKLGQADLNNIQISGELIDEVSVRDFALPKIMGLYKLPNFLLKGILRLIPLMLTIDADKCNNCLICAKICPQKTIEQLNSKVKINPKNCILCLCCSEMCPNNAIYLRFLKGRRNNDKQNSCC